MSGERCHDVLGPVLQERDALRAQYQEVLRWYNDALAVANEAGIHATAAEAMRMLAEERDELRSERDAINEERRLLRIELAHARHETCICDHPHGECVTCGCLILAAENYESELSRVREERDALAAEKANDSWYRGWQQAVQERNEARRGLAAQAASTEQARRDFHDAMEWRREVERERDALAAQVAALSSAAQTMHDWCDDVQKDTEHPCDFMRPGYEPGDTIFRKLGEALALTPTDAVARIEALEAVVEAARRRSLRWHDTHCLALRMDNYEADRCTCGHTVLRRALAHPALRYIGKEKG